MVKGIVDQSVTMGADPIDETVYFSVKSTATPVARWTVPVIIAGFAVAALVLLKKA